MSAADVELVRIGTPLHDIGKIGIDDSILRKPDRLTPEEFEVMKLHTVKGSEIIDTLPDLHPIRPIVRHHHERLDGSGYPDGLRNTEVPLLAQIVSIVDIFDALTTERPYRNARPHGEAFDVLSSEASKGWRDRALVDAFVSVVRE
jgi:putative two-component system response regulator